MFDKKIKQRAVYSVKGGALANSEAKLFPSQIDSSKRAGAWRILTTTTDKQLGLCDP